MKLYILIPLVALVSCAQQEPSEPRVIAYNFAPEFPVSERYAVTVEQTPIKPLQTKRGAILNFGMSEPVTVRVNLPVAPKEVIIRPLNNKIQATIEGNSFSFQLPEPLNLSVEIDGDLDDPLLVFANPELPDIPSKDDPKVKYYEAGKIHHAGEIFLKDEETLYLEPGAIVNAVVRSKGARNVAIRGGGILNAGYRKHKINQLALRECQGAVLENFILLDTFGWTVHLSGSEDIQISNIRIVGWRANSDGINTEYSKKVRIDKCFIRSYDDSMAVKALYPPGGSQEIPLKEMIDPETLGRHKTPRIPGDSMGDLLVTNCVIWNDGAQALEIGFELRIDRVSGIIFRDCDIIHARGGPTFSIHNGDRARIDHILLENIRVENLNRLFDFHVGLSIYSDDCPMPYRRSNPNRKPPPHRPEKANNPWQWYVPQGDDVAKYEPNRGSVRDVIIRNLSVLTKPKKPSIFHGYSDKKGISNITFEGLTIAGKEITSADQINLYQKHVRDLQFIPKRETTAHWDPVIREMEGFTIHVDPQLLPGGEHEEEGARALNMLRGHLQRIAILITGETLEKLKTCEIWIEHAHPELSNMQYHPSEKWLTDRGYDGRLAKKVHITHAHRLLLRSQLLKHPAVVLHELAHAYHDQILGFDHPAIIEAYEKAMAAGIYDNVLLYNGERVKHYAATNHKEYFAEATESFFYRNDFYPFTAAELNEHDPGAYQLMKRIWNKGSNAKY
jgi:hypothetical protein